LIATPGTNLSLPSSVTIAEGETSAQFTITAGSSSSIETVTASYGSLTAQSTVYINTPLPTQPIKLSVLLDRLRTDASATLREVSVTNGWPVETDQGYIVVDQSPSLGYVTGDFDSFTGTPMTADSGFAYAIINFSPGDVYRFTDLTNFESDPWSRAYGYDALEEYSLFKPSTAHLERLWVFDDPPFLDRKLHIWVPGEEVTHLLYLQDGQNLFDPNAVYGGWNLQSVAPAGMMLVGIESSTDRISEYTHVQDDIGGGLTGGDASLYTEYIRSVIRPIITYTYGEPLKIGLLGSSLGGLASLYIANQYPTEFDFVGSMSGVVGWGSIGAGIYNQTIIQLIASGVKKELVIYLDSGGSGTCIDSDLDGTNDDGSGTDNMCENIQLRDALLNLGYQANIDLFYWWEPDALHNESAWSARAWRPLNIFSTL